MLKFTETLTLRFDRDLLRRLRSAAEERGLRLADFARAAVRDAVEGTERAVAVPPVIEALNRAKEGRPTQADLDAIANAARCAPASAEALEVYRNGVCEEMIHAQEALVQAMIIIACGGTSERLVGFMAQVDDHLSRAGAGIRGLGAFGMIAAESDA